LVYIIKNFKGIFGILDYELYIIKGIIFLPPIKGIIFLGRVGKENRNRGMKHRG